MVSSVNPLVVGSRDSPLSSPFYPLVPSTVSVDRALDEHTPLTLVVAPTSIDLIDSLLVTPPNASLSPVVPVLSSLVDFPPLPTAPTSPPTSPSPRSPLSSPSFSDPALHKTLPIFSVVTPSSPNTCHLNSIPF